jgi:hypothetical protein
MHASTSLTSPTSKFESQDRDDVDSLEPPSIAFGQSLKNSKPTQPGLHLDHLLFVHMSSKRAAILLLEGRVRAGNYVSTKTKKDPNLFVATYVGDDKKSTHKAYFRFEDGKSVAHNGKQPEWANFQDFRYTLDPSKRPHAPGMHFDNATAQQQGDLGTTRSDPVSRLPDAVVNEPSATSPTDQVVIRSQQQSKSMVSLNGVDLTTCHDKESNRFKHVILKDHGFIGFADQNALKKRLAKDQDARHCGIYQYGDSELRRLYYSKKEGGNVVVRDILINGKGQYIPIRDGKRCAAESLTAFLDGEWSPASGV